MSVDIEFMDNCKPQCWYGCSFIIHNGKPRLIETRYPISFPRDLPMGVGKKPPLHVVEAIIRTIATKATMYNISLESYPDKDLKVSDATRAKKRPMSNLDITNAALKKLGSGEMQSPRTDAKHYETGLRRMKNFIPLVGDGNAPSILPMRDAAELQRLVDEAIKNGAFFPRPPSTPEDGKA